MSNWRTRFTVVPAVYVIFREDKKVLFLKRANTGYFDDFYSLPSGHFEGGEPAKQVAIRETKEEVGITVKPQDLRLVHTVHRIAEEGEHERIDLFFEADTWTGKPYNAEPHKASEIKWIDISKLPENMVPVVRESLALIDKGEPYSEYNFEV
ncbi:MAG TPA: NUDIX domain-containing protein [Candidatus Saccharimonadales bacterium]|nr:NUDIX domain-containing protein [Candidatus Saccharimonadales bacterium]